VRRLRASSCRLRSDGTRMVSVVSTSEIV
jgi:hypothetical protein